MRAWMLVPTLLFSTSAFAAPLVSPVDTESSPLKLSMPEGWTVTIEPLEDDGGGMFVSGSPDCLGDPDYKGPKEDFQIVAKLTTSFRSAREWLKDQFPRVKQTTKAGWTCVTDRTEAACVGKVKGLGLVMVSFGTIDPGLFKRAGGADLVRAVATSLRFKGKKSALAEWRRPTGATRAVCK